MNKVSAGFDFISVAMPVFMATVFILVFVLIIITIIKSLKQWSQNNASPILTVAAKVTAKRINFVNASPQQVGSTRYFATFEVESGDRMELPLSAAEYGMLAENDTGRLTFQGTRFLSFERSREKEDTHV